MSAPLVSIITATLNSLPGLERTVLSVASQSFKSYEHVIVDGASTDGTASWLESNPLGLRWVSEPDTGIGEAMNKGVAMAKGEWILVLQAEDTFVNSKSLAMAAPALDTEADVVCFDVDFQTNRGPRHLVSKGFSPRLNFKPFPHQGAFTRRRLFEQMGGFDTSLRLHPDYDFYLRAYRKGATADVVQQVLSVMPDTGVTSRRDWPTLRQRFAEERAVQLRSNSGRGQLLVYQIYWPPYMAYRWSKALLSGRMHR
jgi:glycosyltransferase involved in cell wall biosynthesis